MHTKIFLPENLYKYPKACKVFGKHSLTGNSQSLYVAGAQQKEDLQFLGTFSKSQSPSNPENIVNFKFAENPKSYPTVEFLRNFNTENDYIDLFLYDPDQFEKLQDSGSDDFQIITNMHEKEDSEDCLVIKYFSKACDLISKIADWSPIETAFNHTATYSHYQEWKQFKQTKKKNSIITLDRILGIVSMILLLYYVKNPAFHLMSAVDFIILKLRILLDSLKGNPAGLKLNVHLNELLLSCFNYHIDLWEIFICEYY